MKPLYDLHDIITHLKKNDDLILGGKIVAILKPKEEYAKFYIGPEPLEDYYYAIETSDICEPRLGYWSTHKDYELISSCVEEDTMIKWFTESDIVVLTALQQAENEIKKEILKRNK